MENAITNNNINDDLGEIKMMRNQVVKFDTREARSFSLTPRNFEEAMQYSKLICESDFCPREHKGKPGNVLIAVQYGAELGLQPMQALQNISVINGRPCVWGDAMLGIVKAHPFFVDINEEIIDNVAYCRVLRKNSDPVEKKFGVDDAKKANLWGKAGPWTQYPERMLQMRARSFALRDAFPDVLKGLSTREEVEDYEVRPIKRKKVNEPIQQAQSLIVKDIHDLNVQDDIQSIKDTETMDELKEVFTKVHHYWKKKKDLEAVKLIMEAKDKKKSEIHMKEFNDEIIEAEIEETINVSE